MDDAVPEGFTRLLLQPAGFTDVIGPLHGKREDGRFVMGIRVAERHCNAMGRCHGGALAGLADMLLAMGSNLEADLSSFLLTVNLSCDYLGAAALGAWLEGRVDVLRVTRTLVFAQGLITAEGAPVLRASAVLRRPGESDPAFAADRLLPVT